MASKRPRFQLALDFDGTITKDDTTAIIGSRCLDKTRQLAAPGLSENKLPKPMEYYSKRYMQDYDQWNRSRQTTLQDCTTVDEVVSFASASRQVEQSSYIRVREAIVSVPGGVHDLAAKEDERNSFMLEAGRSAVRSGEVEVRDPASLRHLISLAERTGNNWAIISVSWSRRFILGVLLESGLVSRDKAGDMVHRIRSNEMLAPVEIDEDGQPVISCTARDKLDALNELVTTWDRSNDSAGSNDTNNDVLVYVGDSSGDVGCLSRAMIGFHLQDPQATENPVMQRTVELGINKVAVKELLLSKRLEGAVSHSLCTVTGFDEIDEWASMTFEDLQ